MKPFVVVVASFLLIISTCAILKYINLRDVDENRFETPMFSSLNQVFELKTFTTHTLDLKLRREQSKVQKYTKTIFNNQFQKYIHDELPPVNNEKVGFVRPDPEINMNASQLIASKGFPVEEHYVQTEDGYILGMQRIPQPSGNRLPVLVMHGLLSSSDCFLTNLVNESLAYILYTSGYDVWLGNVRGNTYSTRHVTLSPNNVKFWAWSFDEMGKYDIPAMVDFVLKQTGHTKLNYIGHSQGTTCLFSSALSLGKNFSPKINKFIALAPAGIVSHMTSPLHYLSYVASDIAIFYKLCGEGDFLPLHGLLSKFAEMFCPDEESLCENVLFLFGGSDLTNMNRSRVPVYLSHNPAGTSTQNMIHWAQMYKNKNNKLSYYDYGWLSNLWHYKSIHPPSFDFTNFTIPSYIFCGTKDTLVVPQDCTTLYTTLPRVKEVHIIPGYTHLDFVWAVNAPSAVYTNILEILHV